MDTNTKDVTVFPIYIQMILDEAATKPKENYKIYERYKKKLSTACNITRGDAFTLYNDAIVELREVLKV